MKTIVKILFLLCISTVNIMAADYTISGKLMRKVTDSYSNTPGSSTDCDGVTTTLPSSTISVTRMTPAVFSSVTIKVFTGDSTGTLRYTFTPTKAQIGWNDNPSNAADSGKFQYNLTGMAYSRFNYRAYVYLDGSSTSTYSEEFMLSKVAGIPVGTIWAYMGDGTDLTDLEVGGWFLCDGRDINTLTSNLTASERTELINLFTRSGKYDPTKLPDLRGRFLRGMDKGSGNDPNSGSRTGGNVLGSIQDDAFESHDHTGTTDWENAHSHNLNMVDKDNGDFSNQNGQYPTGDAAYGNGADYFISTESAGGHDHSLNINSRGGSETRPKNVYVNYIIKCVK